MKRKRIAAIVTVMLVCIGLFCVPGLAGDAKEWRHEHSQIDATYYGRVSWTDKGIAPNVIGYYAKLAGKETKYILVDNPAQLKVYSGVMNKTLLNLRIYDGHQYTVSQKKTTATYIKVRWVFDNYEECYILK
ncbi:MAG: hypothetical protein NC223_09410 [Butyrivibrio sp.]|nr:hypothetical protein [Butyrivibrio sp.]